LVLTRKNIIRYWASSPIRHFAEGWFTFDDVPMPDVATLSTTERDLLRPVLAGHPEYILEIPCDGRVQ
jgi:hypothetical protein